VTEATPTATDDTLLLELRGLRADLKSRMSGEANRTTHIALTALIVIAAFGAGVLTHAVWKPASPRLEAGAKVAKPLPQMSKAEPKRAKKSDTEVVKLEPQIQPEAVIPQAKPSQSQVKAKIATSTNIDLAYWKLTLPVNDDGIVSGVGDATERIELQGFAMPPYFEVASNSISFMAPTNGARTGGSNYPRSELREMDGQGDEYQWRIADGGHLAATLAVNELPMTSANKPGRIIIGQIHGPDDELCRLYFDNGKLYFIDDKAGDEMEETQFDLVDEAGDTTNIRLGDEFSYAIDVDGKSLIVTATHQGKTYIATDLISRFWVDKDLYFKAGAYVQVGEPGSKARAVGTGQGKVTFTALTRPTHDVFHTPSARKKNQDDDNEG